MKHYDARSIDHRIAIADARRREWADPVMRARRLAAIAAAKAGKRGDRVVIVRGAPVPISAIPRDPIEAFIFGGAA